MLIEDEDEDEHEEEDEKPRGPCPFSCGVPDASTSWTPQISGYHTLRANSMAALARFSTPIFINNL
jgi:hypothetical protein